MARVFDSFILMRPSCGTRRSAMSRRDMTLRRADSFMASCTGGCATSFSTPSMRRRMRYIFSYGSKWMSEAPRRMASSSSLLTKRTIGRVFDVVAGDSRAFDVVVAAGDVEVLEIEAGLVIGETAASAASACSTALSMAFCSLSSSTTTASMPRPVWNLISSMACRLVGSATAEEQALAAADTAAGSGASASSLSWTSLTVSRSTLMRVEVVTAARRIRRRRRPRCRAPWRRRPR